MFGGGIFEPEDDKKNMRQAGLLAVQIRGAGAGSILGFFRWKIVEHGMNIDIIMDVDLNMNLIVLICILTLVTHITLNTMRSPHQHSGTLLFIGVKHISYQIYIN
jgi:hypothetical protein